MKYGLTLIPKTPSYPDTHFISPVLSFNALPAVVFPLDLFPFPRHFPSNYTRPPQYRNPRFPARHPERT